MLLYTEYTPAITTIIGYVAILVLIVLSGFLLFKINKTLKELKNFKKSRDEVLKNLSKSKNFKA